MVDNVNQIMSGARAVVKIGTDVVGLFANCSWSVRQDKVPIYILGRYNPAELTAASQEPISLSLTGYRSVNYSAIGSTKGKSLNVTSLNDLLTETDFSVYITDRQTHNNIFTIEQCKVVGYSSGVSARGISDIRLDIIGVMASEQGSEEVSDDSSSATSLPR